MKLYVGNLDSNIDDAQLQQLFAQHGAVQSAAVVTDKFSGASRGFGFVEMSDADATVAMKALDGQQHGRNALRVNEAKPQAAGGGGKRPGGGGGGGKRFGGGGGGGRSGGGGRDGGGGGWRGR